jgi:hypothetical protein
VVSRVMRVPNWQGLTKDQTDVLIGHEMGHALFTDNSIYESLAKDNKRGLFTYLNVVEDARIDRKMKRAYPGLQRVYFNGMRQFHANGPIFKGGADFMFDKDGKPYPVASMKLIDRINLHYKVGAFVKVPFTADERVWLDRIDRAADTDDALAIARALHRLSKEQSQQSQQPNQSGQQGQQPNQSGQQGQPSSEQSDGDDDSDDQQDGSPSDSDSSSDKKDSKKSKKFDKKDSKKSKKSDKKDGDKSDDSDSNDSAADGQDNDDQNSGDSDSSQSGEGADADDSDSAGDSTGSEYSTDDSDGNDAGDAGDGDGDGDESDSDSDSDGDQQDSREGRSGADPKTPENCQQDTTPTEGDDDDVAQTDEDAAAAMKGLSDTKSLSDIDQLLITPLPDKNVAERTVPAAKYADMVLSHLATVSTANRILAKLEDDWKDKFAATFKHMAREFEARKNAKQAQQARIAKSGKLNMERLSQYRWTNDLFVRSIEMPRGKSHGIVMLIDGSGSMQEVFADVLDQTLLFAHFAYAVGIPFEAYMFTNGQPKGDMWSNSERNFSVPTVAVGTLNVPSDGELVGLINTTTDKGSFRRQVRALLALRVKFMGTKACDNDYEFYTAATRIPYAALYWTPLWSGLMIAERHLARMKRTQRLDKVMFVLVSDGEDSSGLTYQRMDVNRYTGQLEAVDDKLAENRAAVVRDTVTKKQYAVGTVRTNMYGRQVSDVSKASVLGMLLDVIRDRHQARTIYLFLVKHAKPKSARTAHVLTVPETTAITTALQNTYRQGVTQVNSIAIVNAFNADGQFVVPADSSIGDLAVIVATSSLHLNETTFDKVATNGMNSKKVIAKFTETMVNNKSNRVFVNTVIPFLI